MRLDEQLAHGGEDLRRVRGRPRRVRERVARLKSSNRSRSTTVRPTRSAARIRRVTRSTSPTSIASRSPLTSPRRRPSACCEPIDPRRRPVCTGRGSRLCASACRCRPVAAPSIDTSASRRAGRHLADGRDALRVQLAARSPGRRPTAARPAAGAGTRARGRAARPAARRAWPPRWRPWRGTSSGRRRR